MVFTFEQFLEYLSPKVKEKYMYNLREYRATEQDFNGFVNEKLDLPGWISHAFLWHGTPENHRYWRRVQERMENIQNSLNHQS
jgi:hypothetical protein